MKANQAYLCSLLYLSITGTHKPLPRLFYAPAPKEQGESTEITRTEIPGNIE